MRNLARKNNDVKHQFNGLKNIISQISWIRDDLVAMAADFELDHDRLSLHINSNKGEVSDMHDESFNFHHVDNTFFDADLFWKRKFKNSAIVNWSELESAIRTEGIKLNDGLKLFIRNKIMENDQHEFKSK